MQPAVGQGEKEKGLVMNNFHGSQEKRKLTGSLMVTEEKALLLFVVFICRQWCVSYRHIWSCAWLKVVFPCLCSSAADTHGSQAFPGDIEAVAASLPIPWPRKILLFLARSFREGDENRKWISKLVGILIWDDPSLLFPSLDYNASWKTNSLPVLFSLLTPISA